MAFQIKKVSEHGTTNPIVARLSLQTRDLVQFSGLSETDRDRIVELYHGRIQPRLLECDDISQEIVKEIFDIASELDKNGFKIQSDGRVIEVPHLIRLEQRVEQFLYSAKAVLREIAKLFEIFFGKTFTEPRFDKVVSWLEAEFGKDEKIAGMVQDHKSWIKDLIDRRNAVEHPDGNVGRLSITNFKLVSEENQSPKLAEPTWQLGDLPEASVANDLLITITNLLEFAEDLLVACMIQHGFPNMMVINQIPENERNADCPIRLRVGLKANET